jgi:hypothetical protein
MPIDSAASLLFNIGADSSDAEANVQRFRALLGKDLDDLSAEFGDWSNKIFGDLTTVAGAMAGATAALAAGAAALGVVMVESTNRYAEYVSDVERGARATGIQTEQMSGLKLMADETGVSYDSLVTGLTRFASNVVKAADGSKQQLDAFAKLGISQEQVKAGEKDMMPLLDLVADGFHKMGASVISTAEARALFGRGAAELLKDLEMGSEGLKKFQEDAKELGLVITTQDVVAVNEYKAALKAAKSEQEALDVEMGRHAIGIMEIFRVEWAALIKTIKEGGNDGFRGFFTNWVLNIDTIGQRVHEIAEALGKLGDGTKGGDDPGGAKKMKENFTGLRDLLMEVLLRQQAITGGEEGKITAEIEKLQEELKKATAKYSELRAAGKLAADDAQVQAAAMRVLPGAILRLQETLRDQLAAKELAAQERTGTELQELILRQGQQTLAVKGQLLELEVQKRREAMEKERTDTAENLALLGEYEVAGRKKITDEMIAAIVKGGQEETQADLLAQKRRLDAQAAGDQEVARLGEQLERVERLHQTSEERIEAQYDADVAKYDAAEEKKTLATAVNEQQRATIENAFAALRKGLTDKEQQDLQQLYNSQGWRGIFGDEFTKDIQHNEQLMKEWATSSNQSLLMVKVALESMKEMAQKAFEQMAQGMGAGIAHAMIYEKSIGAAMKAALVATLESLAGQAYAHAIYSLALGFLDLATGDEAGAVAAFEAAALFAAVGTASAMIGRAIGPGGSGGGAGSDTSKPSQTSQQASASRDQQLGAVGAPGGASGPHVTVNVWGHVVGTSGVSELCGMLNDAVMGQGATLTATNTTTGKQVQQ